MNDENEKLTLSAFKFVWVDSSRCVVGWNKMHTHTHIHTHRESYIES